MKAAGGRTCLLGGARGRSASAKRQAGRFFGFLFFGSFLLAAGGGSCFAAAEAIDMPGGPKLGGAGRAFSPPPAETARPLTESQGGRPRLLESFSLDFEGALRLSKNQLLSPLRSSFRTGMPYSEISLSRLPPRGAGFRFGVEILCEDPCRMGLEEFFAGWRQPLGQLPWPAFSHSVEWRAGWLKYPLPYLERNRKEISKATLLRQALPFNGESGAGASMKWRLSEPGLEAAGPAAPRKSLALHAAAFFPRTKLKAHGEFKADRQPMMIAGLEGAGPAGHVFAGVLRRHPPRLSRSGGASHAFGAGGRAFYEFSGMFSRSLKLSLRGEAWGIQRAAPWEISLAGYAFPRVKYGRLGLGFMYGSRRVFYPKKSAAAGRGGLKMLEAAPASEGLLQITWDVSESLGVYWEAFSEEGSLLRQKAWTISLRAAFALL